MIGDIDLGHSTARFLQCGYRHLAWAKFVNAKRNETNRRPTISDGHGGLVLSGSTPVTVRSVIPAAESVSHQRTIGPGYSLGHSGDTGHGAFDCHSLRGLDFARSGDYSRLSPFYISMRIQSESLGEHRDNAELETSMSNFAIFITERR